MTICFALFLVFTIGIVTCLAVQENAEKFYSINCEIKKPYTNILITPVIDHPSEVTGCYSNSKPTSDQEIHVLSLLRSGIDDEVVNTQSGFMPSILIDVQLRSNNGHYPSTTILILHSYSQVMWQVNLSHAANSTNFHIIVNKPSFVVPSVAANVSRQKFPSTKRLSLWIKRRYGAVTSYSLINLANEIFLFLGIVPQGTTETGLECNFSSKTYSRNVKASFVQLQLAKGCSVNNSVAGKNEIVYIVELDSRVADSDTLVHLQQHTSSNSVLKAIVQQNVVLVLKSHEPVEWIVEATGIQGSLLIIAEYPVHVRTNMHLISTKIKKQTLPSSSPNLLSTIKSMIGSIDTYIKTPKANRINIVVQGKTRFFDENLTSKNVSSIYNANEKNTDLDVSRIKAFHNQSLDTLLKKQITIMCAGDKVGIIFPVEETMKIFASAVGPDTKLLSITLADTNCKATQNDTHIFLQSKLHECGSKSVISDNLEYHNQLQFITTKEELENRSSNEFKRLPTDDDDYISEYGSGSDAVSSKNDENIIYPLPFHCLKSFSVEDNKIQLPEKFELKLFAKKDYQSSILSTSFPLNVMVHDHLFAETTIKADLRLCIVTDECWLSESESHSTNVEKRNVLIKQGCPTDLSVDILTKSHCNVLGSDADHYKMRFSFQLSEELMNQNLYLHCRLASCAMRDSKELNTNQCVRDENFCLKQSLRPYLDTLFGKKYSIISKGPLRVVPKRKVERKKEILSFVNPESSSSPENFVVDYSFDKLTGNTKKNPISQQLVFVGLSTEAVVGIAFASFIIGAGLMASLWLIHIYTEPTRRFKQSREQSTKPQLNNTTPLNPELADNIGPDPIKPSSVQICL